ncbi:VCBS repeat-containing protein [Flavobacterium macrobrachii]|uniref:VCBS repeat-containing protein n=2 Tax=Flavobacterium macrobrachii TaxID=591204 RepID=A0ABS2CWM5_9FLAO|nr:VCBS repeat-containing protein [Flavobacterium macrobrachii]
MDIITYGSSNVYWFENKFPDEGYMPKQLVATISGTNSISSIDITDFDGDGDLDILGAESFQDKLFLCTNLDGQGTFAPFQVLKTIDQAAFVNHIDMDNDGDKDLVFARNGSAGFLWAIMKTRPKPTIMLPCEPSIKPQILVIPLLLLILITMVCLIFL